MLTTPYFILFYSGSSVLTLAAPAAHRLLRHAVLSSATLMCSSKDNLFHFLMLSVYDILGMIAFFFSLASFREYEITSIVSACPKKAIFLSITWPRGSQQYFYFTTNLKFSFTCFNNTSKFVSIYIYMYSYCMYLMYILRPPKSSDKAENLPLLRSF